MKAYHYLLIAISAFVVGIPSTVINMSRFVQNQALYLGLTLVACTAVALIGFTSFMASLDMRDQERRRNTWTKTRTTIPSEFA